MKKVKRLVALVIATIMIVSLLASCVGTGNGVTIIINATSDTLEKGASILVSAIASNGEAYTLTVDHNDIVEIVNNNTLRVKEDAKITSNVEVTLTATLNEDPTVFAIKKVTVKADVEKVKIIFNASSEQIDFDGRILFSAVASDGSDVRIKATGDNANLVKIENNNTLTVVGDITMDTAVTVVAELVADTSVFVQKVITIKGPPAGSWIKITPSKYTITQASDGYAIINVSAYKEDAKYTVTISGDPDKIAYYNVNSQRLFVIRNVTENKEITLTATLDDEPTVKHSVKITIAPAPVAPVITINTKDNVNSVSKDADLALNIKVSTDEAYDLTVSDPSLVKVEGAAGSEKLTVIGNNTFDKTITVTATLRSDPSVKTTKTFVVNAPRVPGEVSGKETKITTEMFKAMNTSITISGLLTDVYENFNEKNVISNKYDIVVKMTDGKWYGAWNVIENGVKGIVNEDTYFRSEDTATINGVTGHIMKRSYINMNNEVAEKSIVNGLSVPVLWENQHLWNHFGVDDVENYVFREDQGKDGYEVYEFNANKTNEDVAYFLTYLSFAYTPLLKDTLDRVYLKVDISTKKIIGMIAYTEFIYEGASSEADGASAVSYSMIELNFTDVGTTTIPEIKAYSEPTHADVLQSAINNMKAATNYTFTAIDTTTYAPSIDDDDYSYESIPTGGYVQTMSTSKNYTASVSPLGNGNVGLQGFVTSGAILLKSTFKYSAAMDDNVFRIENFGYYQKNDNYYDYFTYNSSLQGFEGQQQYSGSIADKLPKWNFSANIFEFIGNGGSGSTPTYRFRLRDASITRDVAIAVSMYSYSRNGSDSATRRMEIEVATDGSRVVSTMYPYSISEIYLGYVSTTYSNVGSTSIDEKEFEEYAPRVVSALWSAYSLKYYHPDHTTQSPYAEGTGETILNIMFGDKWVDFPPVTVFTDAFGDHVNGPFFEWREISNPNGDTIYKDYFSLTADTDDYDENMTISKATYDGIISKLTAGLAKYGFDVSSERNPTNPADRTDRYISYMNTELGCQIVVENNHTRNFWIYVGYLGDWSFN